MLGEGKILFQRFSFDEYFIFYTIVNNIFDFFVLIILIFIFRMYISLF